MFAYSLDDALFLYIFTWFKGVDSELNMFCHQCILAHHYVISYKEETNFSDQIKTRNISSM